MEFQVLSHAGLKVSNGNKTLICDPWLIGSSYWRSWWIYPPVKEGLIETLKPDYIYLTHLHWDHFHGPSLRLFDKNTPIIVPRAPYTRIKDDLNDIGFHNVIELRNCESFHIDDDFHITSFHFGPFTDSALIVDVDGEVLFNANDSKIAGGPLKKILKQYPKIDFAFCNHSSSNGRVCWESIDNVNREFDDKERYHDDFIAFAKAINPRYVIPFASNVRHLHKDLIDHNGFSISPKDVDLEFKRRKIEKPLVQVMVSGDTYDSNLGFEISEANHFDNEPQKLREYQAQVQDRLTDYYEQESRAKLPLNIIQKYLHKLTKATPFFVKRLFKAKPILLVLYSGDKQEKFVLDFHKSTVAAAADANDSDFTMQIHVPTLVFRGAILMNMFHNIPISKRVLFRATDKHRKFLLLFTWINVLQEHDYLPLRKMFNKRFIGSWCSRWREIFVYMHVVLDVLARRKITYSRYIEPMIPRERAQN